MPRTATARKISAKKKGLRLVSAKPVVKAVANGWMVDDNFISTEEVEAILERLHEAAVLDCVHELVGEVPGKPTRRIIGKAPQHE